MYTPLISASELQALLAGGEPCLVFDCSFELMKAGAGEQQYRESHITGAVRADLDRHLSAAKGATDAASGGRHPLPARETFAHWLGSVGLRPGMQAVVYDRQGANYCGRLWWMLKWLGHTPVAVLDGGLQAWQAAGGSVASLPNASQGPSQTKAAPPQAYPLGPVGADLITSEQVASQLGRPAMSLIDARARPRFLGQVEPLDPVAGHIPGALSRPFSQNFGTDGKFKPAELLRQEFEELLAGRNPATVVHQCGSGVSALPNMIAMEIAGLGRTGLYAGSWSEWCSDPNRPVAQG